jgi:DNA-binding NtrC family response regulator
MKILVVDDDPTIRDYLKEVLNMMGHSVVCVADGYSAIDYVREHDVNLAYIDISMPGIDGFATLTKIRDLDPKVSAVMISGESVDVMLETNFQKGMYVCLAKPFTIEEIEEINKAYSKIKDPLEFIYDNPFGFDTEKISGAKILVVDDEKEIVGVIEECLEYENFNYLDTANDGEEAIRKFNEYMHDVVIVDIVMPKKSGIEVLRHVKAISKNSQVIIITANADKNSAITALKLGAYDYIEKPLDIDTFPRTVKRAVEKKLLLDRI